MPPIVQIQVHRAGGDCTIVALSMYLGENYEDVLGAASRELNCARVHHQGMFIRHMKATAKRLGTTLILRRSFDVDTSCGVLTLRKTTKDQEEHAVLLKAGLIFDTDGTVWEPLVFLAHYKYRVLSLLASKDEEDE